MTGQDDPTVLLSEQEARSLLDSQIRRFQHVQNISQGLMVGGVTIVAVIATVFAATYRSLPIIQLSESSISEAVSAIGYVSIGPLTVTSTVALGLALSLCYGFIGGFVFIKGLWILFDVATFPTIGRVPSDSTTYLPERPFKTADFPTQKYSIVLFKQIQRNETTIQEQHARFLNGALRLPTGLLAGIVAIYIYYISASLDVTWIVLISITSILPIFIEPLFASDESREEEHRSEYSYTTLNQEMLEGSEELSRWEKTEFEATEKVVSIMIIGISMIILTLWAGSALL